MACMSSWGRLGTDIGSVIGYSAKKDVRSGLHVELLHGDRCYYGKLLVFLDTTTWCSVLSTAVISYMILHILY